MLSIVVEVSSLERSQLVCLGNVKWCKTELMSQLITNRKSYTGFPFVQKLLTLNGQNAVTGKQTSFFAGATFSSC